MRPCIQGGQGSRGTRPPAQGSQDARPPAQRATSWNFHCLIFHSSLVYEHYVRVSQKVPVTPIGQTHLYPPLLVESVTHRPPLRHGIPEPHANKEFNILTANKMLERKLIISYSRSSLFEFLRAFSMLCPVETHIYRVRKLTLLKTKFNGNKLWAN